ncbi:MAG: GAF domain-containing protein [Bacteroidales bacterium]|nr:GAF domain-containing protein [Bacteroidales bacterium]
MNDLVIFILVMIFGILPLSVLVYWFKYKGTIIYKTAFAILITNMLVAIGSFIIGFYGIKLIFWYIPIGYVALFLGNFVFKKFVQRPIKASIDALTKVSKGDLNVKIEDDVKESNDETGHMNIALDEMIHNLKDTAEFARQVGEGNLDHEIELLGESDHLRSALFEMRDKLNEAARLQEEKRIDEEKRSWANEGLAKLNEILRKQDDVDELSYQILSYLINYMNANQGGIFIKNDEDKNNVIFELKSFYAFNRRKFVQKSFELGEGLVGNCALEKQKIHLTEIPQNYIQITSGLGGSNPKSLVLVPMKMEDEVLGVIEIASFENFEDYQIQFLEDASLSIASSLNMAATNKRTSELLERTQQQAEEMAAQEEEMRQNMEELQATQEESSRRAEDSEMQIIELQDSNDEFEREINNLKKEIAALELNQKKK